VALWLRESYPFDRDGVLGVRGGLRASAVVSPAMQMCRILGQTVRRRAQSPCVTDLAAVPDLAGGQYRFPVRGLAAGVRC
jgi:hypothetical protein